MDDIAAITFPVSGSLNVSVAQAIQGLTALGYLVTKVPTPPTPPTPATTINTLDQVYACMAGGAHQSPPEGVPGFWSWGSGPELDNPRPPANRAAMTYWGQLYYDASMASTAKNARVELRNAESHLLVPSGWVVMQQDPQPGGGRYQEPFTNNDSWAPYTRTEPDGGLSLAMSPGHMFHFYGHSRPLVASGVTGAFSTVQVRIVLDNPAGVDDRANLHVVVNMGMDWWADQTTGDITQASQMCESRFMKIRTDGQWQAVSAWNGPQDLGGLGPSDGAGRYQVPWGGAQYLWNTSGAMTHAQLVATPPPLK